MQIYHVQISDNLFRQSLRVPKSVSKKLDNVFKQLRSKPRQGLNIKKLRGWKDLYRYRISKYRLIYMIGQKPPTVTLLDIGHRKDVYDRLGHDPNREAPSVWFIAKQDADRLIERQPVRYDQKDGKSRDPEPELTGVDSDLPSRFNSVLKKLGISGDILSALQSCKTESQLLNCEVTETVIEKVLNALWPYSVDRVLEGPQRMVDSPEGLKAVVDGTRSLASFLLALDDSQKRVVDQFSVRPPGPRIVKGGPGTGKSTVALYCLRNLVHPGQTALPLGSNEPLRILFTTYTKALVRVSTDLLSELGVDDKNTVEVINVDALARGHTQSDWANPIYKATLKEWTGVVKTVLPRLRCKIPGFAWSEEEYEFLFDEMNQVIVGNEIQSLEEYKDFKRVGRGKRLDQRGREQVWAFALAAWNELQKRNRCLPGHLFTDAKKSIQPIYDYIFIDEAQDLLPVAVRMCMGLVKDKRNVFLTADRNQSIYPSGFSWKRVEDSLDFRGRSTILRRNHRTTRKIMDAIRPLLTGDDQLDKDTLDTEVVRRGPKPQLRWSSDTEEADIVSQWLTEMIAEEGFGKQQSAVLCPTNRDCDQIAKKLSRSELVAKAMKKGKVDLGFDGVKVMTMHGAKGLQFPVVAVVGLASGRMPWTDVEDSKQQEATDMLRRTFFVACSRAMSRLLVVADRARPSPFVEGLSKNNTHWIVT